jgi:hypothetical protein
LTGTFGGSFVNSDATRSYPFTYSISVADTWEYKSVTIAGDTSGTWLTTNGIGIQIIFALGTGSTYLGTAGSWAATLYTGATGQTQVIGTNGATFYITGVQLEVGSVATPFERRPYGTELALCMRYYQLVASGTASPIAVGGYYDATQVETIIQTKVSMRSEPTVVVASGTNYYRATRNGGTDEFDDFVGNITNSNAVLIYSVTGVSGTAGHATRLQTNNASAYLALSSEL